MSTQDPIIEMMNAMDRNPELAEMFRARIIGDEYTATTEQLQGQHQGIAELLEKSVDLSGAMVRVIGAIDARQRNSYEELTTLREAQESMQSAIANMRADINSMEADQSRVEEVVAQLQADVATLKSDVSILKSDMVYVKESLDKINGRLDNAAGANYEFKVQQNLGSIAGQNLRLRRTRTLKGPRTDDDQDLRSRVDEAEDNGIITESENHEMWLLDLIFSGQRREGGDKVLVAAEISITAGDSDISRAKDRAETLHKATGTATIPAVITAHINQERRQAANQVGVVVITAPET